MTAPGRVAVVTGASSGLGRATCVELARAGWSLVAVGRDPARLADTAARCSAAAAASAAVPALLTLRLDVACAADMQSLADATLQRFGRVDALVHCAGILRAPGAPLCTTAQLEPADFDAVLRVNLRGAWLACRALLPAMQRAGQGDVLLMASRSALAGIAFDAAYCASKFGLAGLAQTLAAEVQDDGVRVQAVAPGRFRTEVLAQTGPLPHPADLPPPERVAALVRWMLELPADARLPMPVIDPVRTGGGWSRRGNPPAAPAAAGVPVASATAAASAAASPVPAIPRPETSRTMDRDDPTPSTLFSGGASLRGRVVVVTGGAGGIGLATVRAVAALGADVVVADLDAARVADAAAQAEAAGARALAVAMDVRQEADHARMVAATLERFGRIDALVVCAGILRARSTPPKLLVDVGCDEWDEVMAVNLRGVFLANRAVLPTLVAQRSGTIVNLSSVQGLQGRAFDGPYCASKFGVIGLSQAVADEVRSYGIRVQALMPAAVATPMWQQNLPAPMPGDAIPPERVAELIVFMLLQPEDTMLVGPVIVPVGGRKRKARPAAAPVPTPAVPAPPAASQA